MCAMIRFQTDANFNYSAVSEAQFLSLSSAASRFLRMPAAWLWAQKITNFRLLWWVCALAGCIRYMGREVITSRATSGSTSLILNS